MLTPRRATFLSLLALAAAACSDEWPTPPPPPGTPKHAEAVVREIASAYQDVRAYEAEVLARVEWEGPHGDEVSTIGGRLRTERAYRFRWESDTPWRVLVVADGDTAWTYLPDLGEVRAEPVRRAVPHAFAEAPGRDPFPRLLLLPLLVREDPLDVLTLGARHYEMVGGEEGSIVEVWWADEFQYGMTIPDARVRYHRSADGLVRTAELEIKFPDVAVGGRRSLLGETAVGAAPDRASVHLRVLERHGGAVALDDLPDTLFSWTPPPGVRVVEAFDPKALTRLRRAP